MKTDLTYSTSGIFTTFYPESKHGEIIYNEIIEQNGSSKIYTIHLKNVLYQIKKAGYSVKKAKKLSKKEADKIMNEILNDPMFNDL
tara:strand:- start:9940 stop:10197 length:258 start_codon:yes stop_codon:yes gene_type:complete